MRREESGEGSEICYTDDIMILYLLVFIISIIVFFLWLFVRHQRQLKVRAFLMLEAVRNEDFMFRLPVKGLFFGERALQQALNDMENSIGKLKAISEVESWKKLTRVLTHEIMNATAPISSICQAYLANPKIQGSEYEEGIRAISDTSRSLTAFVNNYRKLTQLQEPQPIQVDLADFFSSFTPLYPNLRWNIVLPQEASIYIDEGMLRQILINLTKNAIEANATIVDVRWNGGLLISNNGEPIPADVALDIFIPFFTTKLSGSGIGLSLARQMLVIHGLDLSLRPLPVSGFHVTFVIS